jgi:tetratricopeptide (TPR) repeat protein
MEIDIRLAGVQLGPYSIQKVREYLDEGLLSGGDQARVQGSDSWVTVTEMLAEHEDAAASGPPGAGSDVDTEPLPPADSRPSDETDDNPESLLVSEPGKPNEPERRAPNAAPNVSHLPLRPKEPEKLSLTAAVEALSKKTILIGPTPPTGPSSSGRTGYSVATTTPLSQTSSSMKKTARAAMVKNLTQQTSPLPTKSISPITKIPAPPAPASKKADSSPGDGVTAGPGQADPSKPRQSLLNSLTAKTVPMRSSAAPPIAASATMPVTAPLPTRTAIRPPSGMIPSTESTARPPSGTVPPPVVNDLTKKLGQMVQPDPISTTKTEPLHPSQKPQPSARADSKAADAKAGTKEEPKVETVKIQLKKIKTAAPPADDSAEGATKAPKRKRSLAPVLYGVAVLSAFVLYYVWSPTHAASQLRDALDKGDAGELDSTVDFDAVRASLKSQVDAQLKANAANNPALIDAVTMLDKSIDLYVTPKGISTLKQGIFADADVKETISSDAALKTFRAFDDQTVQSQRWGSLTDYVIQMDVTLLHLRSEAINWRVKEVDLPPALLAGATPGAPSPLLGRVVETYLERGDALTKKNDWAGAIANYTTALSIDPTSSIAFNARGTARQSKGDLDGASKDFTQALKIDPQMAAAYNGRGSVEIAKNNLDDAMKDYLQALKIDPQMAAAYDGRGNVKTAKEDLEGAIADFTQAISYDANFASAYSDRGFARQANGNLDGAIADYTTALNLKPKTAMVYYNRGLARQSQGNFEAAIVDFDRALAFEPRNAQALYNRGYAKSATRDLDGAIADYTAALALNPKLALAYSQRGEARQAKGDLDNAAADYTKALSIDAKIAVAYYNRGHIKQLKGDAEGAIADSSQVLDLDPKNWQAYFDRGFAKMILGNLDGAQDDLKSFCDSSPQENDTDEARLYLWLIAKLTSSKADADQALSDALENKWNGSPDDLSSKTAAFLLGRLAEADYLAAAASPDAGKAAAQTCEAYYFAGMKRLLMGDKATAEDYFTKAVATNQTDQHEYLLAQAELKSFQQAAQAAPAPASTTTTPPPSPVAAPVQVPVAAPVTAPAPSLAPPAN